MIVLTDVRKRFGQRAVLDGVNLRIDPGEFVCLTGPAAAGKTLLLQLLTGMEGITSGSISLDGADLATVPPLALKIFRRRTGIVFQDRKLLSLRTVAENIAYPLEVSGMEDRMIAGRVKELLSQFGLTSRAAALPQTLSAGEQTRTAIARAIAVNPLILLADEPLLNLDQNEAKAVLQIFTSMQKNGSTVVLAMQNTDSLDRMQVRIVELKDGRIARESTSGFADHTAGRGIEKKGTVMTPEAKEVLAQQTLDRVTKPHRKVKVTAIHSD